MSFALHVGIPPDSRRVSLEAIAGTMMRSRIAETLGRALWRHLSHLKGGAP